MAQGRLAVLDVGAASPLHASLLHEGTRPLLTVYEEDFGRAVADVLFLPPTGRRAPGGGAGGEWSCGVGGGGWGGGWGGGDGSLGSANSRVPGASLAHSSYGSDSPASGGFAGGGVSGGDSLDSFDAARAGDAAAAMRMQHARPARRSARAVGASAALGGGASQHDVLFRFDRPRDCCGVYISY